MTPRIGDRDTQAGDGGIAVAALQHRFAGQPGRTGGASWR